MNMGVSVKRTTAISVLFSLLLGLAGFMTAAFAFDGRHEGQEIGPVATTTEYRWNQDTMQWVKAVRSEPLSPNSDGSMPKRSNTIEIHIQEDDPVKEIAIMETLIMGGDQPRLEIAGQSDGVTSGDLHIAQLLFQDVDADELDIDADVVEVQLINVAAKDDELDLDLDMVTVVRATRGGTAVVFIGRPPADDIISSDAGFISIDEEGKDGVTVDRIRILGPQGSDGFIETILIKRVGVFGRIEVKDAEIQTLILQNVMLDDSTP